jgi:hypothetical protein
MVRYKKQCDDCKYYYGEMTYLVCAIGKDTYKKKRCKKYKRGFALINLLRQGG